MQISKVETQQARSQSVAKDENWIAKEEQADAQVPADIRTKLVEVFEGTSTSNK